MTFFKKAAAKKQDKVEIRALSQVELEAVAGGINSQPLPPGRRITL